MASVLNKLVQIKSDESGDTLLVRRDSQRIAENWDDSNFSVELEVIKADGLRVRTQVPVIALRNALDSLM